MAVHLTTGYPLAVGNEQAQIKNLQQTVTALIDELGHILCNLEDGNFAEKLVLEKGSMKAEIAANAQQISTKVSAADVDGKLLGYSTITQTAEAIETMVSRDYVNALIGDIYLTDAAAESKITQSAGEILSQVSVSYETIAGADAEYEAIRAYISEVSQTADMIRSTVTDVKNKQESIFTQTPYGFTLDGEQTTFTGVVHLTNNSGEKRFSIFHDESRGYETVFMRGTADGLPIVLGSLSDSVYVGWDTIGNEVATHSWVTEQLSEYTPSGSEDAVRLIEKGYPNGYYAALSGYPVGSFGVYRPNGNAAVDTDGCLWGLRYTEETADNGGEGVNFFALGENFLGYNAGQAKTFPKGVWDFESGNLLVGGEPVISGTEAYNSAQSLMDNAIEVSGDYTDRAIADLDLSGGGQTVAVFG